MDRNGRAILGCLLLVAVAASGCRSPYYADRGALLGGLTGAGAGAIIGKATGNTGAGAVIGAGLGAITGSAVGASLDEIEARNRAEIEARLGRPVSAGAVSMHDIIAMSSAGVSEEVMVTHVQNHGMASPLTTTDLITLQQNGVSPRVVQAMQMPPPAPRVVSQPAPPIIVEEHHYGPPFGYHHHCYGPRRRSPRIGWGFSYHGHH